MAARRKRGARARRGRGWIAPRVMPRPDLLPGRSKSAIAAGCIASAMLFCLPHCAPAPVASPFELDGAGGNGAGGGEGGSNVGGGTSDPTLGGPCTTDGQCDDAIDCTFDACDQTLERCRHTPDDSLCQNDAFCDGVERCSGALGCIAGAPVSCSDGSPCTINRCVEETDQCTSEPRDVDQDGDPDVHCGGGDCADDNPSVSSLVPEVCGNVVDDNCNGDVDEQPCSSPQYDTCLDPFTVDQPGTYELSSVATALDYSASCTVGNPALLRDVVAAVGVPAGDPKDVQLTLRSPNSDVSLALLGMCTDPSSELGCSGGFTHPNGGFTAKVRGRSVGGGNATTYLPAYLFSQQGAQLKLRYDVLEATSKPTNETCATALPLVDGVPVMASIVDAKTDLALGCGAKTGELVYAFDLTAPADVHLYATSVDGDGLPVISLRSSGCALPTDEVTCNSSPNAHVFRHSLQAGSYRVAVGASAPTDVQLTLQLAPPTPAPPDEDCQGAPVLTHNTTIDVSHVNHQDDVDTGCVSGGTDAAYALELTEASDVLILGRWSKSDTAGVVLAEAGCSGPADQLACSTGQISPSRAQKRSLGPGSYRVVTESVQGQPMQLTALVRPAVPPTLVPFSDTCSSPVTIPSTGGFFQGTTANAQADYDAGCDVGGQPKGGAPDQMLKLELSSPKRVVLDMQGSAYTTILDVREGPSCPGNEVPKACAAGYYQQRSFLDLNLAAGTYFVQVDGYGGKSGPWFLDVFVVDP